MGYIDAHGKDVRSGWYKTGPGIDASVEGHQLCDGKPRQLVELKLVTVRSIAI